MIINYKVEVDLLLSNKQFMIGILSNMVGGIIFMGIMTWFTEMLVQKIDYFALLFIGYLFVIVGLTLLINLNADLHMKYLFIMKSVVGMGLGMIWVTSSEVCKESIAKKQSAMGNGILILVRTIGGAIGMALFLVITLSFSNYFLPMVIDEGIKKVENSTLSMEAKRTVINQLQNNHSSLLTSFKITDFTQLNTESTVYEILGEMNHLANDYLVKAMAKAFFIGLIFSCIFVFLLPFIRLEENVHNLRFKKGRSI